MKNLVKNNESVQYAGFGVAFPCKGSTDSTLRGEDGRILSAHCTLDNGFEYSYSMLSKNGVLAVVDGRKSTSMPVGVICGYIAPSEEAINETVGRMIHLYKNHQTICIACSIEEFDETFKKIA